GIRPICFEMPLFVLDFACCPVHCLLEPGEAIAPLAVTVVKLLANLGQFVADGVQLLLATVELFFVGLELSLALGELLLLSLAFGLVLLQAGPSGSDLFLLLFRLAAHQDSGLALLPAFLVDFLAAAIPDDAVGFQLLRPFLELPLARFKLLKPLSHLPGGYGRR